MGADWKPSKREWLAQATLLVLIPGANAVMTIVDGYPLWMVLLTSLGAAALVLACVAFYTFLRGPRRQPDISDKELEKLVVLWGRAAGYGVAPPTNRTPGQTIGVGLTWGSGTSWILKWENSDTLTIAAYRADFSGALRATLDDELWTEMLYDILIELGRFGVFVHITEDPLSITMSDKITMDEPLKERDFIDRVTFVRRADALADLVAQRSNDRQRFQVVRDGYLPFRDDPGSEQMMEFIRRGVATQHSHPAATRETDA